MQRQTHAQLRDVRAVYIKPLKERLFANVTSLSSHPYMISLCVHLLQNSLFLLWQFCPLKMFLATNH